MVGVLGPGLESCADVRVGWARFDAPVGGTSRRRSYQHAVVSGTGEPVECTAQVAVSDVEGGDLHVMNPVPL